MSSFYAVLEKVFLANLDKPSLFLADSTWTYRDLLDKVNGLAYVLTQNGVTKGDRLVVQVQKSAQNLALYLASLRIGAVYVPLNTAYTDRELDYFLKDSDPALFIGEDSRQDVPSLTLDQTGNGTLMDGLDSVVDVPVPVDLEASDLAAILYTSGTTGRSKGAMLTHGNLHSNAVALSEFWGWRKDDVLLHALPIFHVHGLFIANHCALLNGTPMIFLPKFELNEVFERIPDCTVLMGVPTFYSRLLSLSSLTPEYVRDVRLFISGSAPLTESTFRQWKAKTGVEILERYGMSETIINTSNPLEGDRVPGTVGFTLPGIQLRIADGEGRELPRGEIGTIEVAGPAVMRGYWRMPEKSKQEIREDGFFITGDLGIQDKNGRVSIVGRGKDLIISGGFNVYPKEIETVIDELPGVEESAVIGVPHDDYGEAVVAVVVPRKDELSLEEVKSAISDSLAKFKQPKAVINLLELPRNSMGKVQKNILREKYSDLMG